MSAASHNLAVQMLDALKEIRSAALNIDGDAYFDREPSKVALRQLRDAIKVANDAIEAADDAGIDEPADDPEAWSGGFAENH
jgi:hypothetical protein